MEQFLAIESLLKVMKNLVYFALKTLFVLFLSRRFGHVQKRFR